MNFGYITENGVNSNVVKQDNYSTGLVLETRLEYNKENNETVKKMKMTENSIAAGNLE